MLEISINLFGLWDFFLIPNFTTDAFSLLWLLFWMDAFSFVLYQASIKCIRDKCQLSE